MNFPGTIKRFLFAIFIFLVSNTSFSQTSKPAIAIVGNSTIAAYAGGEAIAVLMNKDSAYSITDISVPGHTIKQQESKWRKIPSEIKQSLNYVFVEIGLNDLSAKESAAIALARYQALIDLIRSETNESCKIITSTMTPCKNRFFQQHPDNYLISYKKWLDMNKAIIGKGPDKIINFDSYCKTHTKILNDGKGNLKPMYDTGDGIHTTTVARQIIADEWIAKLNWYAKRK